MSRFGFLAQDAIWGLLLSTCWDFVIYYPTYYFLSAFNIARRHEIGRPDILHAIRAAFGKIIPRRRQT